MLLRMICTLQHIGRYRKCGVSASTPLNNITRSFGQSLPNGERQVSSPSIPPLSSWTDLREKKERRKNSSKHGQEKDVQPGKPYHRWPHEVLGIKLLELPVTEAVNTSCKLAAALLLTAEKLSLLLLVAIDVLPYFEYNPLNSITSLFYSTLAD